jgi:hypothetical protein
MSLFSGKIFCNICRKPLRRKIENGYVKWCCKTNDLFCSQVYVEENWLMATVGMRLYWDEKQYLERFIQEQLDHIVFESKKRLVIKFKDPQIDEMRFFDGNLNFGSNFRIAEIGLARIS